MAKPEARWVPSDDCEVEIDGEKYHLHEGERVSIIGAPTVKEMQVLWRFGRDDNFDPKPADDAPADVRQEWAERRTKQLDTMFEELCEVIGRRVTDWDWTDEAGRLLPKPDGTGEPMRNLHTDELYWLRALIRGETPGQRKNGSRPSEPISATKGLKATSKR